MNAQFGARIPGERSIALRMLQGQLRAVLDTLSEREAGVITMRFGLADGLPKTLDEVGKAYGITRERARQIESKTMSKLRHPKRNSALRDYLDDEHYPIQDQRLGGLEERGLIYCERHGWVDKPSTSRLTCQFCPCAVPDCRNSPGRQQKYCSDACRQAAYRRRRAKTSNSGSPRKVSRPGRAAL